MPRRLVDPKLLLWMSRKAVLAGAIREQSRLVWHCEADCRKPVLVEYSSRPYPVDSTRALVQIPLDGRPLFLDQWVRCRSCEACMKHRANLWIARSLSEVQQAQRTWLVTLTLRPEEHYRVECICRKADVAFDERSPSEQVAERWRVIGAWVALWLKRVRKASGAGLRFLCTVELHKSGLPHVHLLVHEVSGTVLKRHFSSWSYGFWSAKLADENGARYVCKYLLKATEARVRASGRYGALRRPSALGESGSERSEGSVNTRPPKQDDEGSVIGANYGISSSLPPADAKQSADRLSEGAGGPSLGGSATAGE